MIVVQYIYVCKEDTVKYTEVFCNEIIYIDVRPVVGRTFNDLR